MNFTLYFYCDQGKEKGILKLEPRTRVTPDTRRPFSPQGSYEREPPSLQPSVDRLSVTFAEQASMASSGGNLFHLPSETPINNEVKFSAAGEGSEDEDYSASLSAVLRQRRASVRRSRKGRTRRPSSPFLPDEPRSRRRSSVFTTSSGDTAISMEEGQPVVSQEQIFENIHLHKEVLGSVKQQPLGMRRKLKIVHQAKAYIKRHEGQLQERLAQSKSTRDIYARFNIWMTTKWHQLKREAANTSNLLIPWELRIKEIESHFGSVVASYFTFLRWLFWVNLVIAFILLVFVIVPEYLTANPQNDGERKMILEDESRNATNLLTLWEFEGVLKYSPIFYGYYSNVERPEYKMPLAYFLTGLVVYIYSFVAILRKMAENSRMSKLSEKEDECIFSWKLFTGWDFMIGNTETAHNRMASIILSFKEALLEEAEKKRDMRNWRIISLRALVNLCVVILLAVSAYAVVTVVSRSDDNVKSRSWWRENETTIVVTVISITFPVFFELLGFLEHYHPRKQLRLQLARIMLLNLLNLYSLIFALFSKIEGMTKELDSLKPPVVNTSVISDNTLNTLNQSFLIDIPKVCFEEEIPCLPCNVLFAISVNMSIEHLPLPKHKVLPFISKSTDGLDINDGVLYSTTPIYENEKTYPAAENLMDYSTIETTTQNVLLLELERLRNISQIQNTTEVYDNDNTSTYDEEYFYDYTYNESTTFPNLDFTTDINDHTTFETVLDTTSTTDNKNNNTTIFSENTDGFDISSTMDTESTETTRGTDVDTTLSSFDTSYSTPYTEITNSIVNTFSTLTNNIETTTNYKSETATLSDFSSTVQVLRPTIDIFNSIANNSTNCQKITFNCTVHCDGKNITQVFVMFNCTIVRQACYVKRCSTEYASLSIQANQTNVTAVDIAYLDSHHRKMYNLTTATKKRLLKLCWETMFGQELIKLTMMDLVFVLLGTLFMDFFRSLFVRYFNRCWCWDLEKKFPEYGDFKIAENILHLINNQGMVWMGMFFSPGLVVLNVVKLMIMMYLRSWAVMTCNVPHEVVFRVSKSNNFYLALLLTMLFLCVLPVGYSIVWVKPSWHCGPFSEYEKIYYILTKNIDKILPKSLNFTLEYIASPAIVIPLLVLLILIIYYLTSLTNSLREANNDLKIQLRRERTEERRKMFQLADTRRRVGSSALDNTPFARWKKALPSLPISKSIDSDDRKTLPGDENKEPIKVSKKKGNIFAKIVGMALDRKTDVATVTDTQDNTPSSPNNVDDETDTDFHETLPRELLKSKDITIIKKGETKKRSNVEFKTEEHDKYSERRLRSKANSNDSLEEIKTCKDDTTKATTLAKSKPAKGDVLEEHYPKKAKLSRHYTSESSSQSKQSDSIGSVIPVIMISTTESDDEILQSKKKREKPTIGRVDETTTSKPKTSRSKKGGSDLKSLRRQSSVDSVSEQKPSREKTPDDGHKYQYSL